MQPRLFAFFLSFAALTGPAIALAGEGTGLRSEGASLFLSALAKAPTLTAAQQRSFAAKARLGSAGRLADVQVEGMASRMVGPDDMRAQMWELSVSQPLPRKGERAADRQRAKAALQMSLADYALMSGDLAADVSMVLAEAEGAESRTLLLKAQVERLGLVLRALDVRLASGSDTRLAERLTVQTRMASMQLMIEEESRMAADALSEARGRLGLAPTATLPAFVAPLPSEILPSEAAAVRLGEARSAEAEAMLGMARASARPMSSLGVRYERERTAMGDNDTLGLAFMSELPWRSQRYARHDIRAAQAERAAASAEKTAAGHRISAVLSRVERALVFAQSSRRLSSETRARVDAEYEALLRSASVGSAMSQSAILELVELLEKATDTELRALRAETSAKVARAELWRHAPVSNFQLQLD